MSELKNFKNFTDLKMSNMSKKKSEISNDKFEVLLDINTSCGISVDLVRSQ